MEPVLSYESSPTREPRPPLPADRARLVLRKLRDLDLRTGKVELDGARCVRVDGCQSPDGSAERALRYRLRTPDGARSVLEIAFQDETLTLRLVDPEGGSITRRVAVHVDEEGRVEAPELAARMSPESRDPREVEHFLRRLVRGAFSQAG